ncbi:hypothetical protein G7Z17_g7832 [Cylindrodendrum hubeiense]|uniref:GHMP kinase C-terminal domain-containing protein n=1 Tax=Cylindrodendrum hubeiense TaxID=595255 RepID=A0A9P5H8B4_9HYPO|nr:hypothetical protein G7Z17_g7832 [Cylindrodendrum hubeiense]
MESFIVKTPCSSANIGPGFDVIGLALSVYLELHVTIDRSKPKSDHPLNCRLTYEGQGEGTAEISLDPQVNLITRVALYVLRCHGQRDFPVETHVHIKNPIPLGRASAALPEARTPARPPPDPPHGIGHHIKFPWAKEIKAVAIIPDFQVPTHRAREVLPEKYPRVDVTFNLQRIALLPVALGQSPPDPELIHLAMQDKIHQPYRQVLIPGLTEIVESMSPKTEPGFLGVCLSGAGPTILALATHNFEEIANKIIAKLREHNENKNLEYCVSWGSSPPVRSVAASYPEAPKFGLHHHDISSVLIHAVVNITHHIYSSACRVEETVEQLKDAHKAGTQ